MNSNYIHVYPEERRQKLVKELTNYLLNKGYQISKPMIEDLALFVSDKIDEYGIKGSMHLTTSALPHGEQPLQVNPKSHHYEGKS